MPIPNEDRLKTLYDRVNSRIDQFERERGQDEQELEERRREELRKNDEEWERIFG